MKKLLKKLICGALSMNILFCLTSAAVFAENNMEPVDVNVNHAPISNDGLNVLYPGSMITVTQNPDYDACILSVMVGRTYDIYGYDDVFFYEREEESYSGAPVIDPIVFTMDSVQYDDSEKIPFSLTNEKYYLMVEIMDYEIGAYYSLGWDLYIPEGNVEETGFYDVSAEAYYGEPVIWGMQNDIVTGVGENIFCPNDPCNKCEILTFLWRSQGRPEPTIENPFIFSEDYTTFYEHTLSESDYYYKAVIWANEKELIKNNFFELSNIGNTMAYRPCSRSEAALYLWKLAGSPTPKTNHAFSDVPSDADYAQAVAWAVEQGITSGTDNDTFSPEQTCTRGQIITFLYRAFAKQ